MAKDAAYWKELPKSMWQWLFRISDVRNGWYLLLEAKRVQLNGIVAFLPRMLPVDVAVGAAVVGAAVVAVVAIVAA